MWLGQDAPRAGLGRRDTRALRREPIIRHVGAETIVYDTATHRAHCLGRMAAMVWNEWNGVRTANEIAVRVSQALGEPVDETSVRLALSRLEQAGLVAESPMARKLEQPLDRRAALRGVAAAAGLTVLSLAVPSPAQVAATCRPKGDPCTRSSDCCTSCCNANSGRCSNGRGNCAVP